MFSTKSAGPRGRSPGFKLLTALLVAGALSAPLLMVFALVWDRQNQSDTAHASIVEGWGGRQILAGPVLAIPYQRDVTHTDTVNGQSVTKTERQWDELLLWPQSLSLDTGVDTQKRSRAIYKATVYQALARGEARFALPADLAAQGIDPSSLVLSRAELRLGLSDAAGLFGDPPHLTFDGRPAILQPGHGPKATGAAGVFGRVDASALPARVMTANFDFHLRGSDALALAPRAGDTLWTVHSRWPSPSFQGRFLPASRTVRADGFEARYRIGNLALGKTLVGDDDGVAAFPVAAGDRPRADDGTSPALAAISFIQPVDVYSEVNRAVKYGFLFIGFTFLAFLLFDIVGGARVTPAEYLLVGAALVLFFVMLLAFAEVTGFLPAYLVASGAIIGLISAYSSAVLKSLRRAGFIAVLLTALYAILYELLSAEAYSLVGGAVMLFAALTGVMWATRKIDWSSRADTAPA